MIAASPFEKRHRYIESLMAPFNEAWKTLGAKLNQDGGRSVCESKEEIKQISMVIFRVIRAHGNSSQRLICEMRAKIFW